MRSASNREMVIAHSWESSEKIHHVPVSWDFSFSSWKLNFRKEMGLCACSHGEQIPEEVGRILE